MFAQALAELLRSPLSPLCCVCICLPYSVRTLCSATHNDLILTQEPTLKSSWVQPSFLLTKLNLTRRLKSEITNVVFSVMKSGPLNGRYESLNLTCTCLNDQSHGHDKVTYGRMCYFQLMLNFGCVSSIVFLIIILLFLYYKQPGSIQSCKCVNLMHPVWGLDRAI